MNERKVEIAMQEAVRFLLRVDAWKTASERTYEENGLTYSYGAPAEKASLRRASSDLSRALVEMRKS